MNDYEKLSGSGHRPMRDLLRVVGPIFIVIGGIFLIIALVDFFSAFGGGGMPKLFWMGFVGMPLLGIGVGMSKAGYMGAIMRYQASEMAPVASDTVNYMGKRTKPGVKAFASAISEGFAEGAGGVKVDENEVNCPQCDAGNEEGSKFCDQCGTSLKDIVCSGCGVSNGLGSKFCDQCGQKLS
ncbi:zinc ribbon domain-containing protein [Planctomycetota bacterium]|nr:zinc ribbon domain-containing protein [Planctomycetota bacterium]